MTGGATEFPPSARRLAPILASSGVGGWPEYALGIEEMMGAGQNMNVFSTPGGKTILD